MPDKTWTGAVSGSLANASNWNPTGVPVAGDRCIYDRATRAVSADLSTFRNTDNMTHVVGRNMFGAIGTPASPLEIGSATIVQINSLVTPSIYLDVTGCDELRVQGTSAQPDALALLAGGFADVRVEAAGNMRISGGQVDKLRILGSSVYLLIEDVVTLLDAWMQAGRVDCLTQLTNLFVNGGEWRHSGATNNNIATLLEMHGGVFDWRSPGSTITQAKVFGGRLDCRNDGETKSLQSGECWTGGVMELDNGLNTIMGSAPLDQYGGIIRHQDNISVNIHVPALGRSVETAGRQAVAAAAAGGVQL